MAVTSHRRVLQQEERQALVTIGLPLKSYLQVVRRGECCKLHPETLSCVSASLRQFSVNLISSEN
jgi:hypothetical protein